MRNRLLVLVVMAMVMFSAGLAVNLVSGDPADRILGAVAILGALAIVIANVFNGKGHD